MDFDMKTYCLGNIPGITERQAEQFSVYCDMLIDWNSRMNLTAITDPEQVAQKHFMDSILPAALIPEGASVIDVGTGAGFPGIPLLIMRPDIKLTLLDSLNKRITFLTELCARLGLPARCIHARAEDAGRKADLREQFDVATSRAVANVSALAEYTVPFLKVGGASLMYKGPQAPEELAAGRRALELLCCEAEIHSFPAPWGDRTVIALRKLRPTAAAYPRKAGTAEKKPL